MKEGGALLPPCRSIASGESALSSSWVSRHSYWLPVWICPVRIPSRSSFQLLLLRGSRFRHDLGRASNPPACLQFDLLVELFQDEEKASSPSGQAPGTGGRTRLSVKPDKSREKSSKEHKKTVGCQVGPTLLFLYVPVPGCSPVPPVPENPVLMGPTWAQLHPFLTTAFLCFSSGIPCKC